MSELVTRGHRRAELDGVRGLSVGIVIVTHGLGVVWATGILIDAFFVLSGFLLTAILLEDAGRRGGAVSARRFYGLRIARLLPGIVVMLLLTVVLSSISNGNPSGTASTGEAVTWTVLLVANWYEVVHGGGLGYLDHVWFLAIEEQFYVLWPFVLAFLLRRRYQVRYLLAAIAVIMLLRAGLVLTETGRRHELWSFLRFDTLMLGAIMAFVATRPKRYAEFLRLTERTWLALVLIVVFFGGALVLGQTQSPTRYALLGLSTTFAACAGFGMLHLLMRPDGPAAAFFSSRPLVLGGRLSYGLYLYHYPLFVFATKREGWSTVDNLLFVGFVTPALVLASYYLLELPIMRAAVRRSGVRSTAPSHSSREPEALTPVDAVELDAAVLEPDRAGDRA